MLDTRLIEIHLCDLFQRPRRPARTTSSARPSPTPGSTADDLPHRRPRTGSSTRRRSSGSSGRTTGPLYDATLGTLAADCRSAGIAAGLRDHPPRRQGRRPRRPRRAGRPAHAGSPPTTPIPLFDLSGTFDGHDPAQLEIAAWDDHPNALGHRRLFLRPGPRLVKDQALYETLFPSTPPDVGPEGERRRRSDRRPHDRLGRRPSSSPAPTDPPTARRWTRRPWTDTHLSQLLDEAAARRPDHPAVEDEHGRTLTYAELARAADRLATRLARWGVGRGDRVGLFLPKGIEAVAAIHGILRSGAAYVPVDPTAPAIRGRGHPRRRRGQGRGRRRRAGRRPPRRLARPRPAAPADRRRRRRRRPRPGRRRLGRGAGRRRPLARCPRARRPTTSPTSSTPRARPASPRG